LLYLLIKAALSGAIIAVASEVARRWPPGRADDAAALFDKCWIGPRLGLRL
jgi:hypothetical protein